MSSATQTNVRAKQNFLFNTVHYILQQHLPPFKSKRLNEIPSLHNSGLQEKKEKEKKKK